MMRFCLLLMVVLFFSFPAFAKSSPAKSKVARILWSQGLKSASKKAYYPEAATPLVDDNRVYIGTHSGFFYALDPQQKKRVVWEFKSSGPVATGAVADNDSIYFGNNKGHVYALDKNTGQSRWEFWVGAEVLGRPALLGQTLYVVTTSREIYAINTHSGNQQWTTVIKGYDTKLTMRGNASVTAAGENLYVGFADGQVVGLSARNGGLQWSRTLTQNRHTQFKDVDTTVIVDGSALFVAGYAGVLARLDRSSGQTLWSKEVTSGTDLALGENQIFLSTNDGHVAAFDKNSGLMRWETALRGGTLSAPSVIGSYVLVGTFDKGTQVLDAANGQIVQNLAVNFQSPGMVVGQTLYCLSSGGKLYAIGIGG